MNLRSITGSWCDLFCCRGQEGLHLFLMHPFLDHRPAAHITRSIAPSLMLGMRCACMCVWVSVGISSFGQWSATKGKGGRGSLGGLGRESLISGTKARLFEGFLGLHSRRVQETYGLLLFG